MEIIKKNDYSYPSYEIRIESNTDIVNAVRSIVAREMDYASQLYDLGKYILESQGASVVKFPVGDPSLYTPEAQDIIWNHASGDMTVDNSVDFRSVDAISVTLARLKEIEPSTSWSQIACLAFWMLFIAGRGNDSYQLQFVQYKLFIEGVNPFTVNQIEEYNYSVAGKKDIAKFYWPIINTNQTTLDIFRKSYAECVVKSNANIVDENWYCTGSVINPPTCPIDLSYTSQPKGTPTVYNTISLGIMNPNRDYFKWLAYDECVLSNATSTISSAPKSCVAPTNDTVVKEESLNKYYFVSGLLATVAIGLAAWSFWPKDEYKEAEKEYQKRIRSYGNLARQ